MKIEFKAFGSINRGYLKTAKYFNKNLAIMIYLDTRELFGTLTTNICPLEEDEAAIDINNFPEAEEVIYNYHLGENTGKTIKSGFCEYPIYKFNLKEVSKYSVSD